MRYGPHFEKYRQAESLLCLGPVELIAAVFCSFVLGEKLSEHSAFSGLLSSVPNCLTTSAAPRVFVFLFSVQPPFKPSPPFSFSTARKYFSSKKRFCVNVFVVLCSQKLVLGSEKPVPPRFHEQQLSVDAETLLSLDYFTSLLSVPRDALADS